MRISKKEQTEPTLAEIAEEFAKALRENVPYRFNLRKEKKKSNMFDIATAIITGAPEEQEDVFCYYASKFDRRLLLQSISRSSTSMEVSDNPTIKVSSENGKIIFEPVFFELEVFKPVEGSLAFEIGKLIEEILIPGFDEFTKRIFVPVITPSIRKDDFYNAFNKAFENLNKKYAKLPKTEIKQIEGVYQIEAPLRLKLYQ
ncbi:MAG: hypothetical protein ACP5TJ_01200 [Candidatus Micrarchaeia archaeon]